MHPLQDHQLYSFQGRQYQAGAGALVGALGVIDAAWLLRMGENARQAATMSSAINGMSQRSVRLNIGLPSFFPLTRAAA